METEFALSLSVCKENDSSKKLEEAKNMISKQKMELDIKGQRINDLLGKLQISTLEKDNINSYVS